MKARAVVLCAVLGAVPVLAQQPTPPAPASAPGRGGPGGGGETLRSPEVAPDGRVTFRLRAPNAREVFVVGFGQKLAMTKNEQGVWTATSDPLEPEIYTYSFNVDGATFNDPEILANESSFLGQDDRPAGGRAKQHSSVVHEGVRDAVHET